MCQHLVPTDAVVGFQTASSGPSYRVVESMAAGLSPEAACADVIAGIAKRCQRSGQPMFEVAILAISKTGEVGAGSTFGKWRDHVTGQQWEGFPYAVATSDGGGSGGGGGGGGFTSELRVCPGINQTVLEASGEVAMLSRAVDTKRAGSGGIFPSTAKRQCLSSGAVVAD